ncbi:hypothetical protein FQN54_000689 [Arachnomyces sp. PD_36]|nr:hypothetical protein FQN54_000689 [Arachnomyces sp. PD_36]
MASSEVHHLFHLPIADHSFSADRQTLAVAKENNVALYQKSGSSFALKDELKGHDKTVTGVDIAPKSGRIVTCSQDRNAYVWERTPTGWKPTLVLLRINRAATFVRWSPSEEKFAVGSGARVIAVCYFEEENDWWISKHLKKPIRSTITTLAWHPNSVLLAAGSTDSHARVFSSFIKGIDTRPEPSAWGERLPFNTVCGEFLNDSAGWIHGCAFSPSGNALAFSAHDSSVTVVYPSAPDQPPRAMLNISTNLLPFTSLIWRSEDELIAAGHDCEAIRFQGNESGWKLAGSIESKERPGAGAREESALNMFRQMDLKGKSKDDTQLQTVHQNTINTIRVYEENGGIVGKFSTSGVDAAEVIMYGPFSRNYIESRPFTWVPPRDMPRPYFLHSTPQPQSTLHPAIDYAENGARGQSSISGGTNPEVTQASMRVLTSSMPEPPTYQHSPATPFNSKEGSPILPAPRPVSRTRDGCIVGQDSPETCERHTTRHFQTSFQSQPHGTVPVSHHPSSPEIQEARGFQEGGCVYGIDARMGVNDPFSRTMDYREKVETSHSGDSSPVSSGLRSSASPALKFQECVVLAIRQLCTDAARRYWQTKRPRPNLSIEIPSSRSVRRTTPYPGRQRTDALSPRHYHDSRGVLPWTRDPYRRAFTYSDTLEDLIWRISEQEWSQATTKSRDWSSAGAHAERLTAVHRMSRIYDWTQTVIQGVERVRVDGELLSRDGLTDVLLAARDLAVWLLAEDEKEEIQRIWGRVMGLGGEELSEEG